MGKSGWALLAAVIAAAHTPVARGETVVAPGAHGDATWTEAGSPYRVSGDVEFDTLSIEAGSQVLVAATESRVIVRTADFIVRGEALRPVVFEGDVPNTDSWYGVVADTMAVTHVHMRHASQALTMHDGTVTRSVFETSGSGIFIQSAGWIDGCTFRDTGVGVFAHTGGLEPSIIVNSVFLQNLLDGVACNGGACVVRNCTFDDNEFGIYASGGPVAVANSIFTNNRWGLQNQNSSRAITVTHSTLWQNHLDTDGAVVEGDGNLAVDPRYADEDLRLHSHSPCIDAGMTQDAPDHDRDGAMRPLEGDGNIDADGSSFDMGAYEYDPTSVGGGGGQPSTSEGGAAGADGDSGIATATGPATTDGTSGTTGSAGSPDGTTEGTSSSGGTAPQSDAGDLGAGGASTSGAGAAPNAEDTAARTSRGCGCLQAGTTPRGGLIGFGLLLVGVAARRRTPRRRGASSDVPPTGAR